MKYGFWPPEWHWHGWRTLLPVLLGTDQDDRRCVVLGWTITGRLIIGMPWRVR